MGIRIIPCVFGEEQRIKKLLCVFWMFFVFERGEKCVEKLGREQNSKKKKKKKKILSPILRVPGAFYSPNMNFEVAPLYGRHLQTSLDGFDIDMSRNFLTSCF